MNVARWTPPVGTTPRELVVNAKERPVWTHDPGALLAASVGGRYAGSAMTIRNDTAAGAGTQAIRWCVVCRQRTGASTDVHEAGYPAQAACRIVDATVTWDEAPRDSEKFMDSDGSFHEVRFGEPHPSGAWRIVRPNRCWTFGCWHVAIEGTRRCAAHTAPVPGMTVNPTRTLPDYLSSLGGSDVDEARAFVEAVPWLFQADVPCAPNLCIAEGCEAVVDYRLEFCDYHADVATGYGGTE